MNHGRRIIVLIPEIVLAAAVVAGAVWTAMHFWHAGYLPQPFVFDTNDTFMDWFNTAYWANNPGAYSVWRTVYPPISFVFLDWFTLPGCYLQSSFHARDCDWLSRATIYAFYVIDVALVWVTFWRRNRATAPLRTMAFALGLPLLFTLERGNLIIVCFAFFVIAHGRITRSPRWQWISMAVTINFKPYLLLPVLSLAVARRWRALEAAGLATVIVYLVTYALVGSGSLSELASNTSNWVLFQGGQVWNEVHYSTSYMPLLQVRAAQIPILNFISSRTIETIEFVIPIAIRSSQGLALLCLAGAWLQPGALSSYRVSALLLGISLISQSPGGYAQTFLLFLVFMERWRGAGPIIAIVCAYLLCIPADRTFSTILQVSGSSWLGGRTVVADFGLALGHLVRPGLLIIIFWALAYDSLLKILRAHGMERPALGLGAPA